jgi:hypothetical protein
VTLRWADEMDNSEPLPVLEPFFILAALELGDPDGLAAGPWMHQNAGRFYDLYRTYRREVTECGRSGPALPRSGPEVLVQYLIWYPREASKCLSGKP